ncbi:glycoside hydrolase family 2 protein [Marinilabilia rubra]|uniref:Beta-galactosidase n=1 Tax=Marinilabilia rubra TaxID=2162893 RepID=A0A2U2B608_9BACT|nr:sugar-binding domain-containing protein [Marinilabilia rubra]PWD98511.1 beta-galactosidase [Marinilabilia rubra]
MNILKLFFLGFILLCPFLSYAQEDVLKYEMKTRWTNEVSPNDVWDKYPRPQMVRDNWENLNGLWEYAILPTDNKKVPEKFQGEILVPFAIESKLSRVKKMVDEDNYLWYKTSFKAPLLRADEDLLLHFGAVDWEAQIFLNGKEVGLHKGGYDPFSFNIAPFLEEGDQELVVRVWDPTDKGTQPRGKQLDSPRGIWYTPVTGIWQTVWLEKVPQSRIELVKPTPDVDSRNVSVEVLTNATNENLIVDVEVLKEGKAISREKLSYGAGSESGLLKLSVPQPRLWSPEDPFLYDLNIRLLRADGTLLDEVESYFGMRKISLGKDAKGYTRILLNDKPLFQWGLLDQGWWPDGLYTPPTEEAMLFDVEKTLEMGFNMIRKHVKVEPARYYYHCDKMGVLVWQDMPNGNYFRDLRIQAWEEKDAERPLESAIQFEEELKAMMDHFHLFPSILVWVPLNEGWGQYDTERIAEWTEQYDPSRLVDCPSGWADRGVGDMYDIHLYPGPGMEPAEADRASVLGEFGGLGYPVEDHLWWDKKNWGYLTYHSEDEFVEAYDDLMDALIGPVSKGLSAAVYTQTTDVEGEVNGLITYDREVVKIAPDKLTDIHSKLYQEYWDAFSLVKDSEVNPHEWKVSNAVESEDWKKTSFDDFAWDVKPAPFSSYDNTFISNNTEWTNEKIYLRKTFHTNVVPETLFLRHYMPKASARIYLNGQLIADLKDRGGRKRHYTDVDISQYSDQIKNGKNVIAIELSKDEENASFDVGLYTTRKVR